LESRKRRSIIVISVIVIAAVLALTYYQYVATEQVQGRVDHKSISGDLDGTTYGLVLYTPTGLSVDLQIRDLISENATDLTASQERTLIQELQDRGYALHFCLNVEVSSRDPVNDLNSGDTLGYSVDQDTFVRFDMGDTISYEVPYNEKAVIRSAR
jgi:hypothetical protein